MKNLKTIVLSLAISMAIISCSSSDDPSDNNAGNTPVPTNGKLLRYVKSIAPGLTYNSFNTYHYENSKLIKMYAGGIRHRFQFEYQNNKIGAIAGEYYTVEGKNLLTEDFDYTILFDENKHYDEGMGKVDYEGGNIVRTLNNQGATVSFKSNGDISQIQLGTQVHPLEVWEYSYDKDSNTVTKVFGSDVFKYEFDDKINPYYVQYKKFGFYEYGGFINPQICHTDEFLFPNNITKIYKDGILVYSAIFQYDDDGYPIIKSTADYLHSNTEYTYNKYEFKYFE